ncbi:MAG: hypothetical protein ACYSU7_06465 [Planctomycetota bacterium]|jgi:hypothetical protein
MPDKDTKKTTDQEMENVAGGAAQPHDISSGPGGGSSGPSFQEQEVQPGAPSGPSIGPDSSDPNFNVGATPPQDTSHLPGGGSGDDSFQQPIDPQKLDAGARPAQDTSHLPGGGSGGDSFQQPIDPQNIDAGAAQPKDISAGPGGSGGDSLQQPIDPQNIDAGAAQSHDVSPSTGGSGFESQSSPLFTTPGTGPQVIDPNEASNINVGATAQNSSETGPSDPNTPNIRVRVQDADLTAGGSGNQIEGQDP